MKDDELQAGLEPEHPEAGSESAPETEGAEIPEGEGEGEGKPDEKDPKGYTKSINRVVFQREEQRRRADAEKARADVAEAQLPQAQRPEVPPVPDIYAENSEALMAERDTALQEAAAFDARQDFTREQQTREYQQAAAQYQQTLAESAQTFEAKAVSQGFDAQQLDMAVQTINNFGITRELGDYIMEQDDGPAITAYLASHPNELESMRGKSTAQAAGMIAIDIRAKAAAASGKSGAPEPPDTLDGGGAGPSKRGPKGATYE